MKLKCQFEILNYGGECVAVPVGENASEFRCTVRLNSTGEVILRALVAGKNESEITDELLSQYDVSREDAEASVKAFISKLCREGFVDTEEQP